MLGRASWRLCSGAVLVLLGAAQPHRAGAGWEKPRGVFQKQQQGGGLARARGGCHPVSPGRAAEQVEVPLDQPTGATRAVTAGSAEPAQGRVGG